MNNFFLTLKIVTTILIMGFIGSSMIIAQESSEQFIPIGQSPGISNKVSYIGKVIRMNDTDNTLEIDSNRGSKLVKITAKTRIWHDRSKNNKPNISATYADCKVGSFIEVKHIEGNKGIADWIKIESS